MLFVFFQEQGQGVRHNKSASTDKDDVVLSGTCQCFFHSFRHGIADRARQTVEDCFCRKIFRRHCPLHGCLCKEVKGFFRHQVQYAVDIFVVDHADNHKEMLMPFQFFFQLDLQILPASGVVPGVAYDFRVLLQNLPAPHQSGQFDHMFETFPYRFDRNIYAGCAQ